MIELIRENKIEEALKFASEQMAERGEESELVLEELERTLALLAFEDPEKSPYGDLLSYSHRQKVYFIHKSVCLFSSLIVSETPIFTKIKVAWIELKLKIYYSYDPLG